MIRYVKLLGREKMEQQKKGGGWIKWVIGAMIVLAALYVFRDKRLIKISRQATRALELQDLQGEEYYVYNIPDVVIDYMKKQERFADYFYGGKKLVIYTPEVGCPYRTMIINAVNQARQVDPSIDEDYNFVQLSQNINEDFKIWSEEDLKYLHAILTNCSTLCVINPQINQLFAYENAEMSDMANDVKTLLPQLKQWNDR